MEPLQISLYYHAGEILCRMGEEGQEGITGYGKTALEALMDFSSKMEAALHRHYYCSEELIEQINVLNYLVEEYEHPGQLQEE